MLTSWANSLTDHDKEPRGLDVLSHGQCDLWDSHQGCLEQKVICAHAHSESHSNSKFYTQENENFHFLSSSEALGWRVEVRGCLTIPFWRWRCMASVPKVFT